MITDRTIFSFFFLFSYLILFIHLNNIFCITFYNLHLQSMYSYFLFIHFVSWKHFNEKRLIHISIFQMRFKIYSENMMERKKNIKMKKKGLI